MKNKLLILGAGSSHLPVIDLAKKMKIVTVVMDKNPSAIGFSICDKAINLDSINPSNVFNVAKKEHVSGILPTGDYSVYPAAYAAEKLGLPTIGTKIAKLVTCRSNLFQKFQNDGVPIPLGKKAKNVKQAIDIAKKIDFPLILKPGSSFGGSRGVIRVNNISELKSRFDHAMKNSLNDNIIIEEFIGGATHSIESLTVNEKTHVLAISDRERTSEVYCVDFRISYPSEQEDFLQTKIKFAVKKAIKSAGIKNGATHIEAISDNNRIYIHDFGARGGSGGYIPAVIVPNVCGINLMQKMILISLGKKIGSLKPRFKKSVVYGFFHPPPGKIKRIIGLNQVKQFPGVIDFQLHVKKGDRVSEITTGPERPGFYVVKGKNLDESKKRANLLENRFKILT